MPPGPVLLNDQITLTAHQEEYLPGPVPRIYLFQIPSKPVQALVTVERGKVLSAEGTDFRHQRLDLFAQPDT